MNSTFPLDDQGRFVIPDFAARPPFASFLPGIAGPRGIPLWVFYVNRGQAIASFGVESKDGAIVEFQPANKAYQQVAYTGFRTFIKFAGEPFHYEPFSPGAAADSSVMFVGMNEIELVEQSSASGLEIRVRYFTLPNHNLAALVRQLTVTNRGDRPRRGELLDGLPAIVPFGVGNFMLKEMSRTAEAWMDVFNREQRIPFYRVRSSLEDKPEVQQVTAGHFYLAFVQDGQPLVPLCDPAVVFGQDTALSRPDGFARLTLAQLEACQQHTEGRTPCGFFGAPFSLEPGEALTLHALVGHASSVEVVNAQVGTLASGARLGAKRAEGNALVRALTDVIATHTGSPLFDAYCRQNLLDNVMRGGWPVLLGEGDRHSVYHIYSRKHGDLERDYNAFSLAPEYYSQGNGNYRDVNQNRRCDVLLEPRVGAFNIRVFMNLIQPDGYNPLILRGSRFFVPEARRTDLQAAAGDSPRLRELLAHPFTPGGLLMHVTESSVPLSLDPEEFLNKVIAAADQSFEASFGEGYWIDHWTYNLDLIENYLTVYPDRLPDLLLDPTYTYYDSPAVVRPRAERYVEINGIPAQSNAVVLDGEKEALIAARAESPNLVRTAHGQGEIYYTTLLAKLVGLALVKFATLDPQGYGVEMEAGKPGWYDALNGLPALFGSSMCETYELARLIDFLRDALANLPIASVTLPVELDDLMTDVRGHLETLFSPADRHADGMQAAWAYWDAVATERERYRERVRLGFDGSERAVPRQALDQTLALFRDKLARGIETAEKDNGGLAPTYFSYHGLEPQQRVNEKGEPLRDARGRRYLMPAAWQAQAMPLFLEGIVHAYKLCRSPETARALYAQVRASDLYDEKLAMYKVNASLAGQPHAIGRASAFTPGWLENESIWLHMEYKYLLEVLNAGLYAEFFDDLRQTLVPFLDPEVYGRSTLENSSFIASSAHPDPSLHGRGFVARLSGSTAEFLSIWFRMMAGAQPFRIEQGELTLHLEPVLPGLLFDAAGEVSFTFLGHTTVTYYHAAGTDLLGERGPAPSRTVLELRDGQIVAMMGGVIPAPYAARVRDGLAKQIQVHYAVDHPLER